MEPTSFAPLVDRRLWAHSDVQAFMAFLHDPNEHPAYTPDTPFRAADPSGFLVTILNELQTSHAMCRRAALHLSRRGFLRDRRFVKCILEGEDIDGEKLHPFVAAKLFMVLTADITSPESQLQDVAYFITHCSSPKEVAEGGMVGAYFSADAEVAAYLFNHFNVDPRMTYGERGLLDIIGLTRRDLTQEELQTRRKQLEELTKYQLSKRVDPLALLEREEDTELRY